MLLVMMLGLSGGCMNPSEKMRGAELNQPMLRTEVFFGTSRKDAADVSQTQWQGFVDDTITPRFPDGFTVIDGIGQWKDSNGKIVHERSKILLIVHPRDEGSVQKIEEIRGIYKHQFGQESVLEDSEKAGVEF